MLFSNITSAVRATAWLTVLDGGQPTVFHIYGESQLQKFTNIWVVNL